MTGIDITPVERLAPARTRVRRRQRLVFLGPAFVAAIAYVDPGNFATNFSAGSGYGYSLLWVVVGANLLAMPVQYLSAKLGLVTGQSLAAAIRERYPRPMCLALWAQAELVAMATDLAEFVGATIGFVLVLRISVPLAVALTAVAAFAACGLTSRGHRPFELAVIGMFALIIFGFTLQLVRLRPDGPAMAAGLVPTGLAHGELLLAVGILGATVMPHAIYLHSALMSGRPVVRDQPGLRRALRLERADVAIALSVAGVVNVTMLVVAAAAMRLPVADALSLPHIHGQLAATLGGTAAVGFGIALLASGLSSSSVGVLAGQTVMDGFLGVGIPLWLRRGLSMAPSILVLGVGLDPTRALVLSQVVLSFGIPGALIPLVHLTSSRRVMGVHKNSLAQALAMGAIATLIVVLNGYLLTTIG